MSSDVNAVVVAKKPKRAHRPTASTASFKGKPAVPIKAQIEWAIANVKNDKVTKAECPGSIAWVYRDEMRRDNEFLLAMLTKCVPTKQEMGASNGFEDDGRKEFKLIARCLAELEPARSNN